MKRALPIALSLLLCHCGTEVGNGVAPEDASPDTAKDMGSPTSAPNVESEAAGPTIDYVLSKSFIAACASPFAEAIDGTFVNAASTKTFTVKSGNDGKRTVTRSDSSLIFVITPAPTVGPYAIEALPISPEVTCGAVSSQTLMDGTLQRSVTLSSGAVVQWTLSSGNVIRMKLTSSNVDEEIWSKP